MEERNICIDAEKQGGRETDRQTETEKKSVNHYMCSQANTSPETLVNEDPCSHFPTGDFTYTFAKKKPYMLLTEDFLD